uniref:Ceramide kinase n=1 Tax=Echinococcus granulosus TaxID=6210 RepID=A0A068WF60_ECHGR|nr:ceramide kinase [Echinococcus granulosus]
MAVGDSCTGVDVHDLTANEHYITWKWTPLVMGSFSCHQVASKAFLPELICSIGVLSRNANEVGLIVQCVCKLNSGLWRIQTWNAIGPSKEVDSYYHRIKLYRELSIPYRPRSLLVFINPYGGKKLAELIFYSTVRPIFNLAGIRTKVIVTTHQGHCENFMLMEDLHSYDGVVAVGGDGLFSELLQGLLYRTRTDAKLPLYKQHKPFTSEVTPQLRIGLIPADKLRVIYGDARVKTAGLKTGCKIEVTKRVLRRLVSPGNWTRLSILRVTGPDDQSIAQFNRLVEACIPMHSNRREYPRRASSTLMVRPPNHNESGLSRSSPQSYLRMVPVRRNVDTPSAVSNYPNDWFQSCDQKAGSSTHEFGMRTSNDHIRSGSVSYNNTPQSITETVALSRKTASRSRSEATPKPKPRGLYRRFNDSALLSSPPKDMITTRKRTAVPHRPRPESVGISRHLSERQRNKDLSISERTTLNDVTSVITNPATGVGSLRRSNLRNASASTNTKRLHLSRSRIYELEHRPTQELSPDSPRKPRRPRSLGARNRVQSNSDILLSVKREASHRSKSPTKKELKDVPQVLAPLGNMSVRTRPRKAKRSRKSPFPERSGTHSTSPHDTFTPDDNEWGRVKSAKCTPSISPYKLSKKVKQESRLLNKVTAAIDNGGNDISEPSDDNTHGVKSTTSENLFESRSQANRTTESLVDKEAHTDLDRVSESINQTSKSSMDQKSSTTPKLEAKKTHPPVLPTLIGEAEMLDSSIGTVSIIQNKNLNPTFEDDSNLYQLVEHEKYVMNSVAAILQVDRSTAASTSMNDTGAPTPLSSISLNSNKIKGAAISLVEKSANDTDATRQHLAEHARGSLDNQPKPLSSSNEETTGALNLEQLSDVSENERTASHTNSFVASKKFRHGTEVLMTLSPITMLSYANDETIDLPFGILSLLQLPEHEESTNVRVETNPRVRHLVEHVISALSEEAMPSPMTAYGINYSNAESDWNRSDDFTKSEPLPGFTRCIANAMAINEMPPTQSEALKVPILVNHISNSQYLPADFRISTSGVKDPKELIRSSSDCTNVLEDDYLNYPCGFEINAARTDRATAEDPGSCIELSERHEPLPTPPPSECQLLVLPCLNDTVDQIQFPPPPPSPTFELVKFDNCDLVKNEEHCEDVESKQPTYMETLDDRDPNACDDACFPATCQSTSTPLVQKEVDGNACTVVVCNATQDHTDCVVESASLSTNKDVVGGAISPLTSLSIKLNSPCSSVPKQLVIQTSFLNMKKSLKSPGHNSLPSSTSSIPLDLPAPSGPECEQMQLRQPKQDRRTKSAGASPLHFDVSIDISAPRSVQHHGNNSYGLSQNCNASTVVSVDLEDAGTQENTHNATEFSNKGRMESPISITLITELQEEGCGTSTLESICRVAAPVGVDTAALPTRDNTLLDLTYNLSSTNAVIRSIHGTEDVETAAIHIALGFDIGVDVLGIHESSTKAFLRYTVSLLGYGFHGDILEPSERLRWLGPPRYDIAGAIKWLKLASYKCRITYLPSTSSTPFDENICGSSCPVCLKLDRDYEEATQAVEADQSNKSGEARQAAGPATQPHPTTSSLMDPPSLCSQSPHSCSAHPQDDLNVEEAAEMVDDLLLEVTGAEGGEEWGSEERKLKGGWRVITGDFVAVNAFLISCRCAKSPLGPAPTAHLGDGFLDLILVHQCSRLQYLRYLFHLTNQRKERHSQHLRMPFIKAHRVRAFQFQALNRYGDPVVYEEAVGENTSVWCVDGEILRNPNIICCVHRQLIRMYGRGPEL